MIKRILLTTMALALALCGMAQKATLNATLKGAAADTRVVISVPQGGRLMPSDTLVPDNKGRVKFSADISAPAFYGISLTGERVQPAHLILLPGEKVSLTLTSMPAVGLLAVNDVKGSANMEVYSQFSDLMVRSVTSDDQMIVYQGLAQVLQNNPGQLMSAFLVTFYEQQFDQFAPLYKQIRDALIKDYANNDFVRHLDSKLKSALVAGMEAPDIALPDRDGKTRRLSDLRGRVVLIDFWASWCRPCRMENPNVVRLYQRYHDKGFDIYSVSLDNNREAWLKAIGDDHLDWENHVSDLRGWSSAGGKLYGIQSIPSTVLVGPDGKILARNLRGGELEKKLNEILGD